MLVYLAWHLLLLFCSIPLLYVGPELRPDGNIRVTVAETDIALDWSNVFLYNSDQFLQYIVFENNEPVADGVIAAFSTTSFNLNEKTRGIGECYLPLLHSQIA